MPITIEDLTVNFEHVDRAALLADWEWLIGPNRLLFSELRDAGKTLGPGQVFSWRTPPALGGEGTVDNLDATSIEVRFSLTGQLQRQIAELPEGTPISEIRIEP